MNQKIIKKSDEIERTRAKIAELQALLPELEREKMNMENTELIRVIRSANIPFSEITSFVESIKQTGQAAAFQPELKQEALENDTQ
jgi:hypothetical protein